MMQKRDQKAFTLIELLGVLVILVVLMLIVSPMVLNFIKDGENDIDAQNVKTIEMATENMLTEEEYLGYLPDNNSCYISVDMLKENGFLDRDMKDNNSDPVKGYVVVTPKGKSYTYEYQENLPSQTLCQK